MRKVAIFDFDGTLSKGYISMELLKYIHKKGFYSKREYKNQIKMYIKVKAGLLGYKAWCREWGISSALGVKGQKYGEMKKHAKEFFREFKKNIYTSSYEIVKILKKKGYYTICLSVGAIEGIELAAKELGIDEVIATKLEVKNGLFTGKVLTNVHMPGKKKGEAQKIFKRKGITKKDSYGFGDSESDLCFLELVENPYLLNAKKGLQKIGKEKGWKVIDTKNIAKKDVSRLF